jgi:hypothetical protein
MRAMGIRRLLVYCWEHRCGRNVEISAERWPDDVRLSDLEPLFTYQSCGPALRELKSERILVGPASRREFPKLRANQRDRGPPPGGHCLLMRELMAVKIPYHYRLAFLLHLHFLFDFRNREVRQHQRTALSAFDA